MDTQTRQTRIALALALNERLRRKRMALADKAADDFYTFFRYFAWPVLEPATEYVDNWHVHAMCEHLQAITRGDLKRLLISIPFRMLKSTVVSQAWPAWEWVQAPSVQYLTASYAKDLSVRDAVNSRRIIESDAYQAAFGDRFKMTSDQNVKSRYENSRRGTRFVTSTDSAATGFGGNRIIVDDPISASDADSENARNASIEWFKGTISTRFNNPADDAAVIVHQRLHELDLTGYLLREQPGMWEHLVFPMRYERTRLVWVNAPVPEGSLIAAGRELKDVPIAECTTSLGFIDPRTEEGELLNPKRLGEPGVKALELSLGQYHTDAQLQQRPSPRGGSIFKRDSFKRYTVLPKIEEFIISVDCTFKDTANSDYVAIQVWGRTGADKYLVKRIKERMGFAATVNSIRDTRASMKRKPVAVLIEDKANGSAVIETLKSEIPGVVAINPEGGKVARAFACQPEQEAGNIWLPEASIDPTIEEFMSEVTSFPAVSHDDETDGMTQAINWFRTRERNMGALQFFRDIRDANAAKETENA